MEPSPKHYERIVFVNLLQNTKKGSVLKLI